MNTFLNVFNFIWPYLAVGSGITVFTQISKRLAKLERSGVIKLLFHSVTVVVTFLTAIIAPGTSLVMLILHGTAYSGIANALYPAVKWVDAKLTRIRDALKIVEAELPAAQQIIDTVVSTSDPGAAAAIDLEPAQNTNKPLAPVDF